MFIWRYGKLSDTCDLTDLDQHITERWLKKDAPTAPRALKEALELFIWDMNKRETDRKI